MTNSSINLEHWEKGEILVNGGLGCEDALYVRVGAVVDERDKYREALDRLYKAAQGVRIFVNSRERIEQSTGSQWFDDELASAREILGLDA